MIDIPSLSLSSRSRSRICASIVTSSDVVGSSQITSPGRLTSAIAIMTRCFIPPDNSCGYCLYLFSTSEIPTSLIISSAFSFTSFFVTSVLPRKTSSIWAPTLMVGFRDVIGSWNTNPISCPRSFLSSLLLILSTFFPSNNISPPSKNPGGSGFSLMIH